MYVCFMVSSCFLLQEALESKDGVNRVQTGSFEALVTSQMQSWKTRIQKYEEIRQAVDQKINKRFKDMLRTGRNWKGKIEVDHDAQQVILSVTPHKGALYKLTLRTSCPLLHFSSSFKYQSLRLYTSLRGWACLIK